ncbi:MAG: gamma-glutamyltransferase [Pseudomonadota bacterium]
MMRHFVLLTLSLALATNLLAQDAREVVQRYAALSHPISDTAGMVVAQNAIATHVGAEILADGGNAIDAAVATGFALAVTLPRAGNLGGGGFMLVHLADDNKTVAIDYRESAPAGASRDMFIKPDGEPDAQASRFSLRAAGVPGTVAGLYHAHSRYGRLPWRDVVAPAIELASRGIVVSADMARSLTRARNRMAVDPDALALYYKQDGSTYAAGEVLRQPLLARTLRDIARGGPDAFYRGRVADLIADDMAANGGLITREDLAAYRVLEREPVRGTYRGYDIVSMPPPSSGGVHVVQMLNVLERYPLAEYGAESARTVHLLVEAMRTAFADRSKHLGDPDFYDVPVDWLTSKAYADEVADAIPLDKARRSSDVAPGQEPGYESPDTTHYSIVDADGNAVANTYTLNFSFGSGHAIAGAGFLINNEMDDFSAKPGAPNAFGLLGAEANAIEAGKRPLSSMTPTMVFKDGKPYLVLGSPGGSRIITATLQPIVNLIDFGMNVADAVRAPRIHHQWYPDEVFLERGYALDTLTQLEAMGHKIGSSRFGMGSVQAVLWQDGVFYGAADPRRPDAEAMGPRQFRCTVSRVACQN